ncbi:MAG: hypothetical protein LBL62_08275 [Planctomycetaceae bacterium]|nr:hypothetical protein [Planctomycetaceae bacterium]
MLKTNKISSRLEQKINEMHDSFDAEAEDKKQCENWNKWITKHNLLLKQLPLPPSAIIDDDHFDDFAEAYGDKYPIEPFTIDLLTNEEAVLLLCTLDSYYRSDIFMGDNDYRFDSRVYYDLCVRFNLTMVFGEDFNLPPKMTDFYLSYLENLEKNN